METQNSGSPNYAGRSKLRFEYHKEYIPTRDSVLKIVLAVLGMITLICAIVAPWGSAASWVEFVSSSTMIFTILLWFYYFFQLENVLYSCLFAIPIKVIELGYSVIYTIFYVIGGIVSAVDAKYHSAIGASSIFCFASAVVFGFFVFIKFSEYRAAKPPEGRKEVDTTGDEI